jgi:hypothetical protein
MDIPVAFDTMPVEAVVLTNSSLDSVPFCSLSDFPSDRDPEAAVRKFVRPDDGEKIGAVELPSIPAKSDEV